MKSTPVLLSLLSMAALFSAHAQTTVIVDPTPTAAPVETQTTVTTTTTTPVVQPTPVVVPQPGQHLAEIELVVTRGSVQAYFGRAARGEKISVGDVHFNVKLPSTATVTKLANRDDDSPGSKKVTPDNPWRVAVPFNGPGRYVFNIVDWSDDPVVASCVVKVDGQVVFAGHGSEDDLNGWAQKTYGANVRKTGSREIAFTVAGAE